MDEFFPKNKRQRVLTHLETSAYHQNRRSMDEYIDEFKDLIDLAGYREGLAMVMKFRKGLRHDIQDAIAQLATGRPSDSDPHAWYEAAISCVENMESNALFHSVARTAPSTSAFRTFLQVPAQVAQNTAPHPPVAPPSRPQPNYAPMEIDAAKKKAPNLEICYRCGEPGHKRPQCPKRFDIRHMSMEECEEWLQEKALQKDVEEVAEKHVEVEEEQDFRKCDE